MNPVSQNMPTLLTHATLLLLGLLCFQFLFAFSAIRNWSGRHRAREAQGQEARSQRGPEPERPRAREPQSQRAPEPERPRAREAQSQRGPEPETRLDTIYSHQPKSNAQYN